MILLFDLPAVFTYSTTRMMLASITSLLFVIFFGPFFIRKLYEWNIGQPIRKEECPVLGVLHEKKADTPTMGGVLILSAIFVSSLLWMDLTHLYTWVLLFTLVTFGLIGGYDDWLKLKYKSAKGMSGRLKFALQFLSGALVAAALIWGGSNHVVFYYIPFIKQPIFAWGASLAIFAFLFSIFIVVGVSNAVNLTDGLDGLAAGCILPVALVLAIFAFLSNHIQIARYLNIAYIEHGAEVAVFLCALASASIGFLWYNSHPAQVFMGDTGSLALGALIGVSAIILRREFLLALVGGIFVVETLSVILQVASFRYRNKKRLFLCAPLHHHFEYKGWPETKVVIRFWIIGFLLAAIGLASIKLQ